MEINGKLVSLSAQMMIHHCKGADVCFCPLTSFDCGHLRLSAPNREQATVGTLKMGDSAVTLLKLPATMSAQSSC